jgi:hypothetical protein
MTEPCSNGPNCGPMHITQDPIGLKRCASCGNAFEYDRLADGRCGYCGGPFDARPTGTGPIGEPAMTEAELAELIGPPGWEPPVAAPRDPYGEAFADYVDPNRPEPAEVYPVVRDDGGQTDMVEGWPRTLAGAMAALSRAAWLSVAGGPHEVHRPDGRLIARFVDGKRADL